MKSKEKLLKAYAMQREAFDTAKQKRVNNRNKQIEDLTAKIVTLQSEIEKLANLNASEKDFETFEDFFRKAETKSAQSQRKEGAS